MQPNAVGSTVSSTDVHQDRSPSFTPADMAMPPVPYAAVQKTVGVLGGGQLGRMMATAAQHLGCRLLPLDPSPNSPAGQVCSRQIVGDFTDVSKITELARECDILTVEIEHVNCDALEEVERTTGVGTQPSAQTIRLLQDKLRQKMHFDKNGIPVAPYRLVETKEDVLAAGEAYGYPLMLKACTLAYDGRGNSVVAEAADIGRAMAHLGGKALYVEQWCDFDKELAVMVVRGRDGDMRSYPVVETQQREGICRTVLVPAQIDGQVQHAACLLAEKTVACLEGAGVFGVEMFLERDGRLMVNEVAPRPHNSGHYTIEACHTSQFENHLRAVLGLPLGDTAMRVPAAAMVNIIGVGPHMDSAWLPLARALAVRGGSVHWYGKGENRAGRKMGHVTVVGSSMVSLLARCHDLGYINEPSSKDVAPLVGVIMGSDSDLPAMEACCAILDRFAVPYECTVVSAHRTPDRLMTYAKAARGRGLKVIIAAAGGAAHLPGMTAAMTSLPVIGVPVPLRHLDGVDSLYSICQMPRGVPVATVAIGNSTNAALLAIRMLGMEQAHLLDALEEYQNVQAEEVLEKARKMEEMGWLAYSKQN